MTHTPPLSGANNATRAIAMDIEVELRVKIEEYKDSGKSIKERLVIARDKRLLQDERIAAALSLPSDECDPLLMAILKDKDEKAPIRFAAARYTLHLGSASFLIEMFDDESENIFLRLTTANTYPDKAVDFLIRYLINQKNNNSVISEQKYARLVLGKVSKKVLLDILANKNEKDEKRMFVSDFLLATAEKKAVVDKIMRDRTDSPALAEYLAIQQANNGRNMGLNQLSETEQEAYVMNETIDIVGRIQFSSSYKRLDLLERVLGNKNETIGDRVAVAVGLAEFQKKNVADFLRKIFDNENEKLQDRLVLLKWLPDRKKNMAHNKSENPYIRWKVIEQNDQTLSETEKDILWKKILKDRGEPSIMRIIALSHFRPKEKVYINERMNDPLETLEFRLKLISFFKPLGGEMAFGLAEENALKIACGGALRQEEVNSFCLDILKETNLDLIGAINVKGYLKDLGPLQNKLFKKHVSNLVERIFITKKSLSITKEVLVELKRLFENKSDFISFLKKISCSKEEKDIITDYLQKEEGTVSKVKKSKVTTAPPMVPAVVTSTTTTSSASQTQAPKKSFFSFSKKDKAAEQEERLRAEEIERLKKDRELEEEARRARLEKEERLERHSESSSSSTRSSRSASFSMDENSDRRIIRRDQRSDLSGIRGSDFFRAFSQVRKGDILGAAITAVNSLFTSNNNNNRTYKVSSKAVSLSRDLTNIPGLEKKYKELLKALKSSITPDIGQVETFPKEKSPQGYTMYSAHLVQGYRMVYAFNDVGQEIEIWFVGDHDAYEKFLANPKRP